VKGPEHIVIKKFSTENQQNHRNFSTHKFKWLVKDRLIGIIPRTAFVLHSLSWYKSQASVWRAFGCEGVEIFLLVCLSSVKNYFVQKLGVELLHLVCLSPVK